MKHGEFLLFFTHEGQGTEKNRLVDKQFNCSLKSYFGNSVKLLVQLINLNHTHLKSIECRQDSGCDLSLFCFSQCYFFIVKEKKEKDKILPGEDI